MRVIIIDDELPARKKIRTFLADEVEIIGEASNGLEAVNLIEQLQPDLIFLDIQMPGLTGFEVLQALDKTIMPAVIFTTAYDEYAVKAFEVNALDYLLKPFDEERFQKALERVNKQNSQNNQYQQLTNLLLQLKKQPNYLQRLLIKTAGKIVFIKTDEINWIEAEEKYVQIHVGKDKYLYRETMNALEQQLNSEIFARIHRSYIVRIDFIKELVPWSHGDYLLILQDKTELSLGRNYRDKFLNNYKN
ncbi:MAG: response regulator transcription factor [Blastocatellia bacterium]|nr:response regulator transcription factor [Blastocatellia bacterium]MBL8193916.1 response regulator transcription factor [Blastocatellia bacterium]